MTSWIVTISDHKTQEMWMRGEAVSNNPAVLFFVLILLFLPCRLLLIGLLVNNS